MHINTYKSMEDISTNVDFHFLHFDGTSDGFLSDGVLAVIHCILKLLSV